MKYRGGPFDGQDITTSFDHLPVIRLEHPRATVVPPRTVESYELRSGQRLHTDSEPYPHLQGAGDDHQ